MSSARITCREAVNALFPLVDPDISAVRRDEDMAAGIAYPDNYTEAEVDRLLEEVDRELAAEEHSVSVRLTHAFIDQRRAHRAHRRTERTVLRSLPLRLDVADLETREAA